MIDVSVIICTHNPRPHYLSRVLDALRHQTLSLDRWELLLIDNASHKPLTSETWDLSWHPRARIIREDELGVAVARQRGMRDSSANLLVFVDDDNILDSNYLSEAVKIGHEWPLLGVWGSGCMLPEFEIPPPDNLKEFLGELSLREIKKPQWSNVFPPIDAKPYGAGLCVRADVAAEYCRLDKESVIRMTDRVGKAVLAAGDVEIGFVASSLGRGRGLFPELKLMHLIPRERLSEDYLVRIREGWQTSDFLLEYKWQGTLPASPFASLGTLSIFKNLLIKRGIHRRMYVAELRAKVKARAIVAASVSRRYPLSKQYPK
jgi:glycosyltransferase involved in cell wall biosynthesis